MFCCAGKLAGKRKLDYRGEVKHLGHGAVDQLQVVGEQRDDVRVQGVVPQTGRTFVPCRSRKVKPSEA